MSKIVNVAGVGPVEFPDDATDDEIASATESTFGDQIGALDQDDNEPGFMDRMGGAFEHGRLNMLASGSLLAGFLGLADPDEAADMYVGFNERAAEHKPSKDLQAFQAANKQGWMATLRELFNDPHTIPELVAESGAASLSALGAGVATGAGGFLLGGPAGATVSGAAGLGTASGLLEGAAAMSEYLREKGINPLDRRAVAEALRNRDLMDEIGKRAGVKGAAIGALDAFSAGIAGRLFKTARDAFGNPVAKSAARKTGEFATEVGVQGALGGAGEFVGQQLAGEELDRPGILAEVFADIATSPLEVIANKTLDGVKAVRERVASGSPLTDSDATIDIPYTPDGSPDSILQSFVDEHNAANPDDPLTFEQDALTGYDGPTEENVFDGELNFEWEAEEEPTPPNLDQVPFDEADYAAQPDYADPAIQQRFENATQELRALGLLGENEEPPGLGSWFDVPLGEEHDQAYDRMLYLAGTWPDQWEMRVPQGGPAQFRARLPDLRTPEQILESIENTRAAYHIHQLRDTIQHEEQFNPMQLTDADDYILDMLSNLNMDRDDIEHLMGAPRNTDGYVTFYPPLSFEQLPTDDPLLEFADAENGAVMARIRPEALLAWPDFDGHPNVVEEDEEPEWEAEEDDYGYDEDDGVVEPEVVEPQTWVLKDKDGKPRARVRFAPAMELNRSTADSLGFYSKAARALEMDVAPNQSAPLSEWMRRVPKVKRTVVDKGEPPRAEIDRIVRDASLNKGQKADALKALREKHKGRVIETPDGYEWQGILKSKLNVKDAEIEEIANYIEAVRESDGLNDPDPVLSREQLQSYVSKALPSLYEVTYGDHEARQGGFKQYSLRGQDSKNYREFILAGPHGYNSGSHFPVAGNDYIAHFRTSDVAKDGKNYLLVEEIQSDRSTHLRQRGNSPDLAAHEYYSANDAWQDLVLKRITTLAATENYDGIIWTTPRQQKDRYNLERVGNKLVYTPANHTLGVYQDSRLVHAHNVEPEQLAAYIGPELASVFHEQMGPPEFVKLQNELVDVEEDHRALAVRTNQLRSNLTSQRNQLRDAEAELATEREGGADSQVISKIERVIATIKTNIDIYSRDLENFKERTAEKEAQLSELLGQIEKMDPERKYTTEPITVTSSDRDFTVGGRWTETLYGERVPNFFKSKEMKRLGIKPTSVELEAERRLLGVDFPSLPGSSENVRVTVDPYEMASLTLQEIAEKRREAQMHGGMNMTLNPGQWFRYRFWGYVAENANQIMDGRGIERRASEPIPLFVRNEAVEEAFGVLLHRDELQDRLYSFREAAQEPAVRDWERAAHDIAESLGVKLEFSTPKFRYADQPVQPGVELPASARTKIKSEGFQRFQRNLDFKRDREAQQAAFGELPEFAHEQAGTVGTWHLKPEVIRHYQDIYNEFRNVLNEVTGKDVNLEFVDSMKDLDNDFGISGLAEVTTVGESMGPLAGAPLRATIYIAMRTTTNPFNTLFHEAWHMIEDYLRVLTPAEYSMFERELPRLRRYIAKKGGYSAEQVATLPPFEVRAWAAGMYNADRYTGEKPQLGRATAFLEKLHLILRRMRNFINGLGFQTAEDVFDLARAGMMARRPRYSGVNISELEPAVYNYESEAGLVLEFPSPFKRWFGNSVVKTDDGHPRVMYTATNPLDMENITAGRAKSITVFDAPHKAFAALRRRYGSNASEAITPVFVKVENPLRMDAPISGRSLLDLFHAVNAAISDHAGVQDTLNEFMSEDARWLSWAKMAGVVPKHVDVFNEQARSPYRFIIERFKKGKIAIKPSQLWPDPTPATVDLLTRAGYDGLVGTMDDATYVMVAKSNQVKHIQNRTPTDNPHIRHQFSTFGEATRRGRRGKAGFFNSVKDLSWMGDLISSPWHIASKYTGFAPVFWTANEMRGHRMRMIAEAAQDQRTGEERIAAFGNLEGKSLERASAALELARLKGERIQTAPDGSMFIENTGQTAAALSQPGETITLTPEEADVIKRYRRGMNFMLKEIGNAYKRNVGLKPNVKSKDLSNAIAILERLAKAPNLPKGDKTRLTMQINRWKEQRDNIGQLEGMAARDYVPFSRFGKYGVTVKDASGKMVHFETADTVKDAKRLRDDLVQKYPGEKIGNPFTMTYDNLKRNIGADILVNMDTLVSMLSTTDQKDYGKFRDDLEKLIATKGFGRHFVRADNIPGYSTDFKRSVGQYIMGAANYASRLRYNRELTEALSAPELLSAKNLTNYARNYVDYTLSPVEEWQTARNISFMWWLGFNASSAALQYATLPEFVVPRLGEFAPSGMNVMEPVKELARATKDIAGVVSRTSINKFRDRKIPDAALLFDPATFQGAPDERAALIDAWETGTIKPLQTLEMSGLDPTRTLGGLNPQQFMGRDLGFQKGWNAVLTYGSAFFNMAEVTSRSMAFLAAYRMAKNPAYMTRVNEVLGNNHLWQQNVNRGQIAPADFAKFFVQEVFSLQGKTNRPRYMRRAGVWIFQFGHYVQSMVELSARMLLREGGAGKRAYIMVGLALIAFGGLHGLPGAEDLKDVIEAAHRKWTGTDLNLDAELRELTMELTGSRSLGEIASRGVFRMTDVDVSKRATLGNLPQFDILKAATGIRGDASDILGVPGSLVLGSYGDVMERLASGEASLDSIIQSAAPAFLKNMWESYKWGAEGVSTKKGLRLIGPEELTSEELILKALGFTPANVARERELQVARDRMGNKVDALQTSYYKKLGRAFVQLRASKSEDDREELREKIRELRREITTHNKNVPNEEKIILDGDYLKKVVLEMERGGDVKIGSAPRKSRKAMRDLDRLYREERD